MVRTVAYLRVSTEEQATTGVSLQAQEEKIRQYAALYDLELVAVYVDAGVSAKSLNRAGLSQALGLLENGEAEALIIAKLDRLTRSVADWAKLIDRHFAKRHTLLSVGDQIDTRTAAGRLVLNVLVSVGQWEREAISERTTAALAYKKSQGKYLGGVPYGYQLAGDVLIEKQDQSTVVTLIRDLRGDGLTLRAIADELNIREIKTQRGSKWAPQTVKNVLDRVGA
jgi:DNA invertase Pin-like site-specific DNA recombinase